MNLIFSDGSFKPSKNKKKAETLCGSGTITIIEDKDMIIRKHHSLPGKQNNYAELHGILVGLELIKKLEDKIYNHPLTIITDSGYAVTVLTDTMILEGKKRALSEKWKTKDGSELKNQNIIKKIYKLITDKDGDIYPNIKFIHVNSHLSPEKNDDVDRIIHSFKKTGIKINKDQAQKIIILNNQVDDLAKEGVSKIKI